MHNQNQSTPSFSDFNPHIIPYQFRVLEDIESNFDYSIGSHEILLSGSVGSAKSILMAHIIIKHCLTFSGARFFIGRKAMPQLRRTLWTKIIEHMQGSLKENYHYKANFSRLEIKFRNGSEIISGSWSDGQYLKFRSLELSGAAFEELSENDIDDKRAYDEIRMRVGRLPHIPIQILISATNPDEPDHWVYKYFIENRSPTVHVYYSVTTENPFLPRQYIDQLKRDLDPLMARRMIYGEWLSIQGNNVYYAYDKSVQFLEQDYIVNPNFPVILTWDFNIGEGKPISMACVQYIRDKFHVFDEVVIYGGRTADTIEELDAKGILSKEISYYVSGDSAGKHKDTRGSRSDYDIILRELKNRGLNVEFRVPQSNPPVRARHNIVNAYCKNASGDVRLFVYKKAKTVDEGLRLTKLKKGAGYIEDDSKPFQHITTALGYAIFFESMLANRKPQRTIQL